MKKPTFEIAMKKLETIVNKLESGNESLESSLKLFEEGMKLSSFCYNTLESAEQRIVKLTDIELKKKLDTGE